MALKDQPYIPLYIQDVLTDEKLIECSAESHGVYFRLICILHKQPTYGVILIKQKYKQNESKYKNFALMLARQLPFNVDCIERALIDLGSEDVIQITGETITQKRMVKDAALSEKRSKAGKRGGSKTQSKDKDFAKANLKTNTQANTENEIEYENESDNSLIKNGVEKKPVFVKQDLNNLPTSKYPFKMFWNAFGLKMNEVQTQREWSYLDDTERKNVIDHVPKYLNWCKETGTKKCFPANYLQDKRYNDELIIDSEQKGETEAEKIERIKKTLV